MMIKTAINRAMNRPDLFVVNFIYISEKSVSIRFVSPFQWQGNRRFIGFCFTREDQRSFLVCGIYRIRLVKSDLLMPPVDAVEVAYA